MIIPFSRPYFPTETRKDIAAAVDDILASGQLMLGRYTERFEREFASFIGVAHAVTTSTCTTALQIALQHFDVRGCDVLVPAGGFITDVSVVRWAGGRPILVDINPDTLAIDVRDLKRKLTPKTKGIIWVHLTGIISSEWQEILAFARARGLFVIEDCAHAHGAQVNGRHAGSLGNLGTFSFYPTKVMTTGTGGMLTTNDPHAANTARELRLFGRERGTGAVIREGNDWFMDEIRAAIGCYQLRDLNMALLRRAQIASRYTEVFSDLQGVRPLTVPSGYKPSWYHYTLFVNEKIDYERLTERLRLVHGVPTKAIYIPLHQETIFKDLDTGDFQSTEVALNRSLCLPIYTDMSDASVEHVIAAVCEELKA